MRRGRFEKWLTIVKFAPLDKFLNKHFPPLDVWMVWHAYLSRQRTAGTQKTANASPSSAK